MSRDPVLYALVHRGTPGDVSFYLRAARGACSVLELGCGYGRLLGPLAGAGHAVVGLDRDEGLLALARASLRDIAQPARDRVALVHGDMCDFDLADRFDRVFIPYSGIYCLDSPLDVLACLECVRRHLTLDGLLVWDAYNIDAFHAGGDSGDADPGEPVTSVQLDDEVYDVYEHSVWERDAQRLRVTYLYQPRGGGAPGQDEIVHRYLLTPQIEPLMAEAGLRVVDTFGDFAGAPLSAESGHVVCVAGR